MNSPFNYSRGGVKHDSSRFYSFHHRGSSLVLWVSSVSEPQALIKYPEEELKCV
jgi:hypothetical protein